MSTSSARNICRDCLGFGYCWPVLDGEEGDPDGNGYLTEGVPKATISQHGFVSQVRRCPRPSERSPCASTAAAAMAWRGVRETAAFA